MARGLNKVLLIGHLGGDPEFKMAKETAIAKISLATSYGVKNSQTGQWEDATEWHQLVLYGKIAETAKTYLRKGSQIFIEGRIQTRKWQGDDGKDRYTTEIIVNEMQMLGGGESNATQAKQPTQPAQPTQLAQQNPTRVNRQPPPTPQPAVESSNFDDDIPF